jgi:Tol biopolymer transport system component
MPLADGARLGPYQILAPLGAGGMGEVYRALDTRLGREVAVKVLPEAFACDPERRSRFEREARAVAALSHPHIVALFDVGEEEGTAYVVTELLKGETLRSVLRRGPLTPRKAVEQVAQVARGLAAAHENGIVHRDLKPENLFVTTDGQLKILDFGLARQEAPKGPVASEIATLTRDTAAGVVLGTVGYMSPEQVQGLTVDHRTDVFALGCVLFETLTGRRAFERPTAVETLTAILKEDPPAFSTTGRVLPTALERTVHRCLEKSPAERFQSARDVAFALEALSGDSQASDLGSARILVRTRRRPWALALLCVALAIAAGLGFLTGRWAASGGPRPTFQRLTRRHGPIVSARFGPDGRTVFYGAAWENGPFRIYQARLEGGELALPVENADLLSVSHDGQLAMLMVKRWGANAWWKMGTLAVAPAAGAAPREVAEDVWSADFAPDGRSLAVVRQGPAGRRLEYPLGNTLYETAAFLFYPRVSPDGERVALFEWNAITSLALIVVDRQGRRSVLGDGWDDWYDLVWSRDGREIWFAAVSRCEGERGSLRAIDLGGRQRTLADTPGGMDIHDLAADGRALAAQLHTRSALRAWSTRRPQDHTIASSEAAVLVDLSTDGTALLFNELSSCEAGQRASAATYYQALDGAASFRVADGWASALSPDGRLAVVQATNGLRLLPTGPGEPRDVPVRLASWSGARWMPDGRRLLVVTEEAGGRARFQLVDLSGGAPAARPVSTLFTHDPLSLRWSVSPDGRSVAIPGGDGRMLLVPLDGSNPQSLPGSDSNLEALQWSPDGRQLYCYRRGEIPARVERIDVATGRRTPWREVWPPSLAATGVDLVLSQDLTTGAYTYPDVTADLYLVNGLR